MKSNKGKARTPKAPTEPRVPRPRGRPRKVPIPLLATTPADRIAAVNDDERQRIAATYGAKFQRSAG